jgi:hypothetical protein
VATQLAEAVQSVSAQLEASATAATDAAASRKVAIDKLLTDITSKVDTDLAEIAENTTRALETLQQETAATLLAELKTEATSTDDKIAELKTYTDKKFGEAYCSFSGEITDDDPPECKCEDGYSGHRCQEKLPTACTDITSKTGPTTFADGTVAYCHKAQDGGWDLAFNLKTGKVPC